MSIIRKSLSSAKSFLHSFTYSPIRYLIAALLLFYTNIVIWEVGVKDRSSDFPWFVIGLLIIGFAIVLFRAFRRYQQRREENVSAESAHTTSESPAIKSLLLSLRRRALGLRLASWFILALTFVLIIGGLYIFTSAGAIARGESSSYQLQRSLELKDFEVDYQLDRISRKIENSGFTDKALGLEEIQKIRTSLEASTKEFRESLQRMDQTYGSNERFWVFLSATSTRVGSVLLLIFLVQILLSVYRYSIRMVSYYEARADALLLYEGKDAEQFQLFVTTLSADKVEFGKAPQSPADQAIELIKSVSALRK